MNQITSNFVQMPDYTALAVKHSNVDYIADAVSPRVTKPRHHIKYREYQLNQTFNAATRQVGRLDKLPRKYTKTVERDAYMRDYGLTDLISMRDVDNGWPSANEIQESTVLLSDDNDLRREIIVADTYKEAGNYEFSTAVSNKWDTADGDPLADIAKARTNALVNYNILILGPDVYEALTTNTKVVQAFNRNSGPSRILDEQEMAQALRVPRVVVGKAKVNTNRNPEGDAMLSNVWNGVCVLAHVAGETGVSSSPSFSLTYGKQRMVESRLLPDVGLYGAMELKVGESFVPVVVSKYSAQRFTGVI